MTGAKRSAILAPPSLPPPAPPGTDAVTTMIARLALIAVTVPVLLALILSGADQALAWWLEPLDRGVKSVFRAISWLGNATLYLVGSALAVLWFRLVRRADALWPFALYALASFAATGLVVNLLKVGLGRTRPGLLFDYGRYEFTWMSLVGGTQSFPSGHAAAIAAAALLLALLVPRLTALFAAIALVVAASRLLIVFHYPSDVLAGLVLGLMIPLYLRDWFRRQPWWREPRAASAAEPPDRRPGAGRGM